MLGAMGDERDAGRGAERVQRLLRQAKGRDPDTGRPLPPAPNELWRRRCGDPAAAAPRVRAPLPEMPPVIVRPVFVPAAAVRPSAARIALEALRTVTRRPHPLRLVRGDG